MKAIWSSFYLIFMIGCATNDKIEEVEVPKPWEKYGKFEFDHSLIAYIKESSKEGISDTILKEYLMSYRESYDEYKAVVEVGVDLEKYKNSRKLELEQRINELPAKYGMIFTMTIGEYEKDFGGFKVCSSYCGTFNLQNSRRKVEASKKFGLSMPVSPKDSFFYQSYVTLISQESWYLPVVPEKAIDYLKSLNATNSTKYRQTKVAVVLSDPICEPKRDPKSEPYFGIFKQELVCGIQVQEIYDFESGNQLLNVKSSEI